MHDPVFLNIVDVWTSAKCIESVSPEHAFGIPVIVSVKVISCRKLRLLTSVAMEDVSLPVAIGDITGSIVIGVKPGEVVVLRDIIFELDNIRVRLRRAVVLQDRLELNAGGGEYKSWQKSHRCGDY